MSDNLKYLQLVTQIHQARTGLEASPGLFNEVLWNLVAVEVSDGRMDMQDFLRETARSIERLRILEDDKVEVTP